MTSRVDVFRRDKPAAMYASELANQQHDIAELTIVRDRPALTNQTVVLSREC